LIERNLVTIIGDVIALITLLGVESVDFKPEELIDEEYLLGAPLFEVEDAREDVDEAGE
jgi:hypothetical protein